MEKHHEFRKFIDKNRAFLNVFTRCLIVAVIGVAVQILQLWRYLEGLGLTLTQFFTNDNSSVFFETMQPNAKSATSVIINLICTLVYFLFWIAVLFVGRKTGKRCYTACTLVYTFLCILSLALFVFISLNTEETAFITVSTMILTVFISPMGGLDIAIGNFSPLFLFPIYIIVMFVLSIVFLVKRKAGKNV